MMVSVFSYIMLTWLDRYQEARPSGPIFRVLYSPNSPDAVSGFVTQDDVEVQITAVKRKSIGRLKVVEADVEDPPVDTDEENGEKAMPLRPLRKGLTVTTNAVKRTSAIPGPPPTRHWYNKDSSEEDGKDEELMSAKTITQRRPTFLNETLSPFRESSERSESMSDSFYTDTTVPFSPSTPLCSSNRVLSGLFEAADPNPGDKQEDTVHSASQDDEV